MRIANIIEYKNYLAENIPPFPEEEKAAKWVREFAEPNGFINGEEGVLWDKIPAESVVWVKEEAAPPVVEEEEDNRLIKISLKSGKRPKTSPPPEEQSSSDGGGGNGFINIKPK